MARITGEATSDVLEGTPQTDILEGRGGDDWLYGREGTDRLIGGDGADMLDGGLNLDWMEGGAGDDLYVVDTGPSSAPIFFAAAQTNAATSGAAAGAGIAADAAISSDAAVGGDFSPARSSFGFFGVLPSVPGGDVLIEESGAGLDTVEQRSALYVLWDNVENLRMAPEAYDARGNDAANEISGNTNTNFLFGGGGADVLFGFEADDHLEGEAGDDTLVGGTGIDYLWGGPGGDTFRFDRVVDIPFEPPEKDGDRIMDFRPEDGDRLDFSLMDANADVEGEQTFTWRGTEEFTGAGQLRYERNEALNRTIIEANVDADEQPDAIVQIIGFFDLSTEDVVL